MCDVIFAEETDNQAGVIDVILPIQQSEFGISITLKDQPDLHDIPGFYQRGSGNFWVALSGARAVKRTDRARRSRGRDGS